jgi:hypothetical protein
VFTEYLYIPHRDAEHHTYVRCNFKVKNKKCQNLIKMNTMNNKILLLLISWFISLNYSNAQNIQLDSLDLFINQLIEDFDVPGLSIGIVQSDSISSSCIMR